MRKVLPFLLAAALAGCAEQAMRWDKPGADENAATHDFAGCRSAAEQEALRDHPPPRVLTADHWVYFDNSRSYDETQLTDLCMRNKGYQRVPIAAAPEAK